MSSLQNKMRNYEVNPPSEAWDKIAAALDESLMENKFPSQLHQMEVTPPATSWEKINNALTGEEDKKIIPLRKRTAAIWRYAAAIVLIGVIAFGISIWNSGNQNEAGTAEIIKAAGDTNTTRPETQKPSAVTADKENNNNQVAYQDNTIKKAKDVAVSAKANRTRTSAKETLNALYTYENHSSDISDRYITLMTPDGNIIRMSKKLGDLACCVSGEEQDEECKMQLKSWQKKLATSSASNSPGNFMDILELVCSLEEGVEL